MLPVVAYRGRFAPSPTGHLHQGSLLAAVASYADALANDGEWWLRLDDIDSPRVVPGAMERQKQQLSAFGFEWQGEIRQSLRVSRYKDVLSAWREQGWLYACDCSRTQLKRRYGEAQRQQPVPYDGHCRQRQLSLDQPNVAWRLMPEMCSNATIPVIDAIQGRCIKAGKEDVILRRRDDILAYHWVCALDEVDMNITHVIRGVDLLDSAAVQLMLIQALSDRWPSYGHHGLVVDQAGIKLSKRNQAQAIEPPQARVMLLQALQWLGQQPPATLVQSSVTDIWQWVKQHWQLSQVPRGNQRMAVVS